MKKILLLAATLFFMMQFAYSQHIEDNSGKTYYDSARTKLKEVYSYKEVNVFSPKGDHSVVEVIKKKHGPYFYYYENGKLQISGWFKNDNKDGVWKYYDEHGKLTKTETYVNGELQEE
jgi:antitoxin component YwqK of YwqJK toxin-antitoxin module